MALDVTSAPPTAASGALILADISGYTSFLRDVATAHRDDAFADGAVPEAYAILTRLLDGIVGRLAPPFTLSKLEGDAVFAYSDGTTKLPQGDEALGCIRSCYAGFRESVDSAHEI